MASLKVLCGSMKRRTRIWLYLGPAAMEENQVAANSKYRSDTFKGCRRNRFLILKNGT